MIKGYVIYFYLIFLKKNNNQIRDFPQIAHTILDSKPNISVLKISHCSYPLRE